MKADSLLFALFLAAVPGLAVGEERIFDIVPSNGQTVEIVEGSTVLRQPGRSFGVVLSFRPRSDDSGWIPAAVLNTGAVPLQVGTAGFSASDGKKSLTVEDNESLVSQFRRRNKPANTASPVNDMPRYADVVERGRAATISGPGSPERGLSDIRRRDSLMAAPLPAPGEAEAPTLDELAAAFEADLFPDALLAPGKFARGDLSLKLPKRNVDGDTTFVLHVAFGEETMDVTYRERSD